MHIYDTYKNLAGAFVALVVLPGAALAAEITADLKQEVMANCAADAYRLCPQSLNSVSEAASCMRHKRADLAPVCRTSFDHAVRVLAQK